MKKCPACRKRLPFKQVVPLRAEQQKTRCKKCGAELLISDRGRVPVMLFGVFLFNIAVGRSVPVIFAFSLVVVVLYLLSLVFTSIEIGPHRVDGSKPSEN